MGRGRAPRSGGSAVRGGEGVEATEGQRKIRLSQSMKTCFSIHNAKRERAVVVGGEFFECMGWDPGGYTSLHLFDRGPAARCLGRGPRFVGASAAGARGGGGKRCCRGALSCWCGGSRRAERAGWVGRHLEILSSLTLRPRQALGPEDTARCDGGESHCRGRVPPPPQCAAMPTSGPDDLRRNAKFSSGAPRKTGRAGVS